MRKITISPTLWLILILTLAAFLRFWQIAHFPAGFNADEVNQGYSAYSIFRTGKDEWGKFLPIVPRSFGDFRSPLYTYLTIPLVRVLGLNETAVRLPSAIFGILAVLSTFLLVKLLFKNDSLALFSAFFLAISPWHFSLSRGAFEANLAVAILPAAFFLFLKGFQKEKYLIISAVLFGLNLFSYYSPRFFTPIFVIFLFWWFRGHLKLGKKKFLFIFGFFFLLAFYSFIGWGKARAMDIGILSADFQAPKIFIDNYLSYFSLEFLFTRGAGEATYGMIPGRGVLYLFELPLLIFAFYSLIKKGERNLLPILAWIVLAPVPASLARGVGHHANRVAIMMPAIQILSAYGLISILALRVRYKKIILAFLAIWIFISIGSFCWAYFRYSPKISAPAMSYGWCEAMGYISQIEDKYQKIIISKKFSEPQIFIAFYKKWEPADFQKESQDWLKYEKEGLKFVDQLEKYSLGKYEFRAINWSEDKNLKNVIFVGKEVDFPRDEFLVKRIIPYPNGEPAFLIVER